MKITHGQPAPTTNENPNNSDIETLFQLKVVTTRETPSKASKKTISKQSSPLKSAKSPTKVFKALASGALKELQSPASPLRKKPFSNTMKQVHVTFKNKPAMAGLAKPVLSKQSDSLAKKQVTKRYSAGADVNAHLENFYVKCDDSKTLKRMSTTVSGSMFMTDSTELTIEEEIAEINTGRQCERVDRILDVSGRESVKLDETMQKLADLSDRSSELLNSSKYIDKLHKKLLC